MLVNELHIDDYLKIEYNEKNNNEVNLLEAVGATDNPDLRSLDFEPDNTNSIFVSKLGSDVSGDGTIENPYKTIQKGIDSTTDLLHNVVINDSGLYEEQLFVPSDSECNRIVANIGFMPIISPPENLEDIKFQHGIISGINTTGTGEFNKTVDAIPIEPPFNNIGARTPIPLYDGTFAVIYYRMNIVSTWHRIYQLRLRIYDATFSFPLSDKLVQEKELNNTAQSATWDTYDFYAGWILKTKDYFVLRFRSSRGGSPQASWAIHLWVDFNGNIAKEEVIQQQSGAIYFHGSNGSIGEITYPSEYSNNDNYFGTQRERSDGTHARDFAIYNGTTLYMTLPNKSGNEHGNYKYVGRKGDDIFLSSSLELVKINLPTKAITFALYSTLKSLSSAFVDSSENNCRGIYNLPNGNYLIQAHTTYPTVLEVNAIPPTSVIKTWQSYSDDANFLFNPFIQKISEDKMLVYSQAYLKDTLYIVDLTKWDSPPQEGFIFDKLDIGAMASGTKSKLALTSSAPYGAYLPHLANFKFSYNTGSNAWSSGSNPFIFFELFNIGLFKTDKALTLDGLTFDLKKDGRIRQVLRSKGDLTIKTCTLKNGYNDNHGLKFPNYVLNKNDGTNIDVRFSSLENFDRGLFCTTENFKLNRSKVARVLNGDAIQANVPKYKYLVAHPVAGGVTGNSTRWSSINTEAIGTTSPDIGAGYSNTLKIIEQLNGNIDRILADVVLKGNYGGYDDWYIPSLNELQLIRTVCGATPWNLTGWTWSMYSSTEHSTSPILHVSTINSSGTVSGYGKTDTGARTIPVRTVFSHEDKALNTSFQGGLIFYKEAIVSEDATIEINHNTVFRNFKGIKITGNIPLNTTVKNNIFHANSDYGLDVENEITIYNTCYTDNIVNALIDSTCRNANPLFIDEGIENVNLTNLNLKSRALGFSSNSPAVELGEEGKDAGCYNVEYVFAPYTYDSFFLPKPKKIGISYLPVNPVDNIMQDGTFDTSVEAFQQETELEYSSLNQKYIKDILKLSMIGGDVKLYYSPKTNPDKFEKCKYVFDNMKLANDLYKLNKAGIKNISLKFIRKFSIDELE